MTDILDDAEEIIEKQRQISIDKARSEAAKIPAGEPGECALCEEFSQRLVEDVCAPCRDKYGLN